MARRQPPPALDLSVDTRSKRLPKISRTPVTVPLSGKSSESTKTLPVLVPAQMSTRTSTTNNDRGTASTVISYDSRERGKASPRLSSFCRVACTVADIVHIVACMVLVFVVVWFLAYYNRAASSEKGPQLVVLLTALALDVLLDFASISLFDVTWTGWALGLRSALTIIYFAILMSFVAAAGHIFPADYSYWNLSPQEAGGPVLGVLSLVFAWNIVHLVLFRHRLAWEVRRLFNGRNNINSGSSDRQRWRRQQRRASMNHAKVEDVEAGLSRN